MKWIYTAILIFAIPFFLPGKSFALQYELLINSSAPTTGTIRLIFEETVDVLVLGIDASLGVIGGAAGKDATWRILL